MPVGAAQPTGGITTVERLPAAVGKDPHPVRQAWPDFDAARCGCCRPGRTMAAAAEVRKARAAGGETGDADSDEIRTIRRCRTYRRIREAITAAAKDF